MKTFFAAASLSLLAACHSSYKATDRTVVVAPDRVHTAFITQYPNATTTVWSTYDPSLTIPIDWDLTGWSDLNSSDYVVRFKQDGDDYYAWYDENGNWIGTAYAMSNYSSMPTSVTNIVNNSYPGYTIVSVNREFQKDRMAYEVLLKNGDTRVKMLVDANGNIIKQKTKTVK